MIYLKMAEPAGFVTTVPPLIVSILGYARENFACVYIEGQQFFSKLKLHSFACPVLLLHISTAIPDV